MRQLLFVLTFHSALFSLCSCKRTPDLTKEEVYKILNEIIADDSLPFFEICATSDDLEYSEEFGFSDADKNFIHRQKEIFESFKFEPNNLKFYSPRGKEYVFVKIDTYCTEGIVHRLSFPLISADRSRVIFKNTQDCINCLLGGQSGDDLYVKKNGKWKFEKSFNRWISQLPPKHPRKQSITADNS
jgi:hypothetical protein